MSVFDGRGISTYNEIFELDVSKCTVLCYIQVV